MAKLTFLCISSYFKGEDFLRACKEEGNLVYLITSSKLKDEAWPVEYLDDMFLMEENEEGRWNLDHLLKAVAYKMRSIHFDRFVALDDFDVEKVAQLREHFRIPGMGDTTSKYFRDKLAMRVKAKEDGIPVPEFSALFHDADIHEFCEKVSPPWMVKPRSEASAVGIKKISDRDTLWKVLEELGDDRYRYLIERFSPGRVYHVDALTFNSKVVFSRVSGYLDTPFEVAHGGGIFRSQTIDKKDESYRALTALNEKLLSSFGLKYSASHSEFIQDESTGEFVFLETSARVGGAHIAEMVTFASGINLWKEWARIENAAAGKLEYKPPRDKGKHAGVVISLSKVENPDSSFGEAPEIVWRLKKKWHIGLIVEDKDSKKVTNYLEKYTEKITREFHASAPAPDKSP